MSIGNPSLRLAVVVAAMCLALAPGALAAKGGGGPKGGGGKPSHGGTGTISLVLLDSTDGMAHYGQRVTFTVSTTSTAYPWVTVKCYQGGLVYQASNGIFATSLNQVFTLGPTTNWQGGAADCTAYLENWDSYSKNGSITTITSMAFHVDG
jgi:hypothetical protein